MSLFGKKIRTRFAPSPTGYLHLGNLRSALYEYLFARQNKGTFVIRIEDTDQTREVAGSVENMLKILKWTGLEPDEGVILDKDGKVAEKGHFGPYTQSKRLEIYRKYAFKLVEKGFAYYCFCSEERLENLRKEQEAAKLPTRYDWHCRYLLTAEVQSRLDRGDQYVIRMKVPEGREIEFEDLIRGRIKVNSREIDDQIILKADGFPTYHLAHVVDDHLMEISHVIRAEEWLPSTPKHLLLFEFFGWPPCRYAHLPLILNKDKTKLSKRQGDVAVEDFRDQGYLPQTLVNYIALLGWNPGTDREIFSLDELIKEFSLDKVHKAGAVFDEQKLEWLNGEYIKKMPSTDFVQLARPYLEKNLAANNFSSKDFGQDALDKILLIEQQRIGKLIEVGEGIKFFFTDQPVYDPGILIWKKADQQKTLENLEQLANELENYPPANWNKESLENKLKQYIAAKQLTNGEVLWPLRVALTGLEKSPPPFAVAEILGKEKTIIRLRQASSLLNKPQ